LINFKNTGKIMINASIIIVRINRKEPLKTPEHVAMADLSMKDAVAQAVDEKNKISQLDESGWVYFYSVESTIPVFGVGDDISLNWWCTSAENSKSHA
jgi:hypothetical protein